MSTPAPRSDTAGRLAPAIGTKAIIGPDTRVPVGSTTTFPASTIVRLVFAGGQCTGFMISERTVATAGHCLHSGGSGGTWRTNVVAYPGHDGTTAPFGGCAALRLFVPANWFSGDDAAFDYGAAQLNCAIGARTGWLNLGYPTRSVTGSCTTTQGYPADRPGQWASDDVVQAEDASFLYVRHPLVSGLTGSPVFYTPDPDDWCPVRPPLVIPCPCPPPPSCVCPIPTVLGILTRGPYGSGPGATNNMVTRVTLPIINNFLQWR
ncbi:trypsin-like serine peptidase [Micromonospora matsumotoense]|uniref:trypsin-like serine peptidase n=1 Tax=Micromonospora matsumotoense TaxID=121616 RepID=UPI001FE1EF75|nr:trypsin-like serine protease [Micromonospora matsumotoense]